MEQQPPPVTSGIPIDALVEQLSSPDQDLVAAATTCLAHCLSSQRWRDQCADAIIESEALDLIIGIISPATTASDETVDKALSTICNIAAGTSMQTRAVVEAGALPQLLRHLESPNLDIVDGAVFALANIAADDDLSFAPLLLDGRVLEPIPDLIKRKLKRNTLQNIAWIMSNLVRQTVQVPAMFRSFVSILGELSRLDDLDTNSSVLKALLELADDDIIITGPSEHGGFTLIVDEIVETSFLIPFIVRCMDVPELAAAAAFLSSRLTENYHACLTMVNEGIVPKLIRVASRGGTTGDVACQASWVLMNLCDHPSLIVPLIEDWDLLGQMLALAQDLPVEPQPDSDPADSPPSETSLDWVDFIHALASALYTALFGSSRPVAHHVASIGWIPQFVRWAQTITSPRWQDDPIAAARAIRCIDLLLNAEPLHPGERPLKVKKTTYAVVAVGIVAGSVNTATSQQHSGQPPPSLPSPVQSDDDSQEQPPGPEELDMAQLVAAECSEALLSKLLMHLPHPAALESTIKTWMTLKPRWAEHSTPTDPS